MRSGWPRYGYGFWPELGYLEVGQRVEDTYDSSNALEHRLCRANGLSYGSPPRHWTWDEASRNVRRREIG